MVLVNTDYISGKELQMIGLVKGSTVRSKDIVQDIGQSFKAIVGGEQGAYTKMLNESREIATQRMVEDAKSVGADAIINVRYTTASVMQNAAEVMAYGTAVKFI